MILTINRTDFDIEDFDEEIVLVHLESGVYYTLKEGGPALLRLFGEGLALEQVPASAQAFVEQLRQEAILVETAGAPTSAAPTDEQWPTELPVLEKFDDVSDLIKLDPIHDVSDLGWPHKK